MTRGKRVLPSAPRSQISQKWVVTADKISFEKWPLFYRNTQITSPSGDHSITLEMQDHQDK